MGHTKGPWEWWTSCSFRRLSSKATNLDGDVLCAVVHSDGQPDVYLSNGGWDGPDGRLIAAAPELLEALKRIANASFGWDADDFRRTARAAIAAATGEPK